MGSKILYRVSIYINYWCRIMSGKRVGDGAKSLREKIKKN